MDARGSFAAVAVVASLLLTGCSTAVAQGAEAPMPSHTMPGGGVMPGSQHGAHSPTDDAGAARGPSEAALMVCDGQVQESMGAILGTGRQPDPDWGWDDPEFRCTYRVDGLPLILSVHDVTDTAEGEAYFAELRRSLPGAAEIEGLAALGMPSFWTQDGIVAFLRDGKTLTVDATALPNGLGPGGDRTPQQIAYAVASAVLVCWTEHD
ncbi:hypothetical protein [Naasia sp. SYSU D00057]|uniref:hypothetical protein n=1 Tax=Naasia sp. SYSU D00057 TaxID=2817380 RepID=UPI001B31388F|nr:hypothetical protein [Naasia sp. SYSU D00057]